MEVFEKAGYLHEHFKLFHLKDISGKEFDYHYHDFDKIIYFIGGKADYLVEGKKYSLSPHDFVLVNRNEIHKPIVDAAVSYERMILYIEHDFIKRYCGVGYSLMDCFGKALEEETHIVHFPAAETNRLQELLSQMEKNNGKEYAGELYGEILFLEFMIQLNRACLETEYAYHHNAKYNKKVIEIIQYVNNNLSEDLSIDRLAERFYLSKYHMMRRFKQETGYSIHQYILEKRILEAKAMLLNGQSAAVASMECGFNDYSTFARAFKKLLGVMPASFINDRKDFYCS